MDYSGNLNMPAEEVIGLVRLFEDHHIEVIIDGGWGVDALLEEQSRPHQDLDIAMPHQYVTQARALLISRGYSDIPGPDTRDCNFVMGDEQGHRIDFHTYTYDPDGQLVFGLPYPLDSLTGRGSIAGYPVRCITPEWLVKFHLGYELDANDYHDVSALCQRFAIDLPGEYVAYEQAIVKTQS